MIVRRKEELAGTEREVHAPTWMSRRYLLKKDGMGFSFHETILHEGMETRMWYKNHLEAVYCVEGEGELEDLTSGERHHIGPGTMYALNAHDRHVLRTKTTMRMLCVFNPPCVGGEVHDDEGAYPLLEEEPTAP